MEQSVKMRDNHKKALESMQIGTVNSEEPGRTKLIKTIITSPRCALGRCEHNVCIPGRGGGWVSASFSLPAPPPPASAPEEPGRWSSSPFKSGKEKDFPGLIGPDAAAMERH